MTFSLPLEDVILENANQLLSIHPSWERVRLGEVIEVLNGYPFPSDQFSNGSGTPLLRIRDVVRGRTETFFNGAFDPAYLIQPGDLVVGMDGDFNCARWRGEPALLNQRVCKLTANPDFVDPSFLDKVLPGYLAAINAATSSMTVKHLSSRTIADIPLPLPPRSEQRRLAEKLDELLSDLDAGLAALERVYANLKRYRAAVLKAAVEGRLTEKWRAAHPEVEPAEKLLERILVDRRKKWEEAQLAKYAEKGQSPPKGWKERYPEPAKPDRSALPVLPPGWCWATIDQCAWEVTVGHVGPMKDRYEASGLPFLRSQNVRPFRFDREGLKFISEEFDSELAKSRLFGGEILAVRSGNIGDTCIFPTTEGRANCADLVVTRLLLAVVGDYVVAYLNSPIGRSRVLGKQTGSALAHFNVGAMARSVIPLPPRLEQLEIALCVAERLSQGEQARVEIERSKVRASQLRQGILKHAFAGKLVPQDPNDEPAIELLARVRAERTAKDGREAAQAKASRRPNGAKPAKMV